MESNKIQNQGVPDASVAAAPAWKNFEFEGFLIDFPEQPAREQQDQESAVGTIPTISYTLEHGGAAYILAVTVFPAGALEKAAPKNVLDGGVAGAVRSMNGELLQQDEVVLSMPDGTSALGREFSVNTKKLYQYRSRIYLVKNKLLQVSFVSPDTAESQLNFQHFADSLGVAGE